MLGGAPGDQEYRLVHAQRVGIGLDGIDQRRAGGMPGELQQNHRLDHAVARAGVRDHVHDVVGRERLELQRRVDAEVTPEQTLNDPQLFVGRATVHTDPHLAAVHPASTGPDRGGFRASVGLLTMTGDPPPSMVAHASGSKVPAREKCGGTWMDRSGRLVG